MTIMFYHLMIILLYKTLLEILFDVSYSLNQRDNYKQTYYRNN